MTFFEVDGGVAMSQSFPARHTHMARAWSPSLLNLYVLSWNADELRRAPIIWDREHYMAAD